RDRGGEPRGAREHGRRRGEEQHPADGTATWARSHPFLRPVRGPAQRLDHRRTRRARSVWNGRGGYARRRRPRAATPPIATRTTTPPVTSVPAVGGRRDPPDTTGRRSAAAGGAGATAGEGIAGSTGTATATGV